MTKAEAINLLADMDSDKYTAKEAVAITMAIQSLTAISELSKSLKAVNRYEMDEKVLIGFNMAVAIFNKCFAKVVRSKMSSRNRMSECVSRMSEKCRNRQTEI